MTIPNAGVGAEWWLWVSSNLLSAVALIVLYACILFYVVTLPWWKYELGRGQLYLFIALALIFSQQVIGIYANPPAHTQWWTFDYVHRDTWFVIVRFLGVTGAAIAIANQARILWNRRYHPERNPDLRLEFEELLSRQRGHLSNTSPVK
jgi:hypothetical protein